MANTQYITANRLTIEVNQELNEKRNGNLLLRIPAVIAFGCISPEAGIFALCGVLAIFFFTQDSANVKKKRAGAKGEDMTLNILSYLPDSYTVFNQVFVPNEKSTTGHTEADFIVVGPNGVFVIENKHHSGHIVGSEKWEKWTTYNKYNNSWNQTRNPAKQLNIQINTLREFTKKQGYKLWFNGVVFFSNSKGTLELNGDFFFPVLQYTGLVDHILSCKPKYPPRNLDKIVLDLVRLKQAPQEYEPAADKSKSWSDDKLHENLLAKIKSKHQKPLWQPQWRKLQ